MKATRLQDRHRRPVLNMFCPGHDVDLDGAEIAPQLLESNY